MLRRNVFKKRKEVIPMYLFYGILHQIRGNGYPGSKDDKTKFKELQLMINIFNQFLPFVGRIQTSNKTYTGLIKELKLIDGQVKFAITDCDKDGRSHTSAKTYRKKVVIEELMEIDTFYLSVDYLWHQFISNKEKTNESPFTP